jgi:hypothetical protein
LNSYRSWAAFLVACSLWTACGGERHTELPIDEVPLTVEIGRLDRDMFLSTGDSAKAKSLKAYATYGEFYRTYIEDILQGAPLEDPRLAMVLTRFTTDPDWMSVQRAADSVLGDLEPQRKEFEDAFKRLKVLFPDSLTPRIVAFNSGFNYGIFPTDSVLGVGVEWFIGKEHPVIGYLAPESFPQYVKDRMRPEMLVPSAVKGWLLVHYTRDIRAEDLLTNLVETGKVLFLLDALLPGTDPALKFAFSKEQLVWCEAHEQEAGGYRSVDERWSVHERVAARESRPFGRVVRLPHGEGLYGRQPGTLHSTTHRAGRSARYPEDLQTPLEEVVRSRFSSPACLVSLACAMLKTDLGLRGLQLTTTN